MSFITWSVINGCEESFALIPKVYITYNSTRAAYKCLCKVKWCGGGGVTRKGFFSSLFSHVVSFNFSSSIHAYTFLHMYSFFKLSVPMVILHPISSSADSLPHSHSFIFSGRLHRHFHRCVRFLFSSLYAFSFLLCLRKSILECFKRVTRHTNTYYQHKSCKGIWDEKDYEGTRLTHENGAG